MTLKRHFISSKWTIDFELSKPTLVKSSQSKVQSPRWRFFQSRIFESILLIFLLSWGPIFVYLFYFCFFPSSSILRWPFLNVFLLKQIHSWGPNLFPQLIYNVIFCPSPEEFRIYFNNCFMANKNSFIT